MNVFSYVVARDFGFAPNPFHQICTLATCKPKIRHAARPGDFVIGTRRTPKVRDIVFFMEVQEILTYDEYWNDARFLAKRPNLYGNRKNAFGDNIYHQDGNGRWIQEDSHHTNDDGSRCEKNVKTDTSCPKVLISQNFAYWGDDGPTLPPQLYSLVKKGPGHKCKTFSNEFKNEVVGWLLKTDRGLIGTPFSWK